MPGAIADLPVGNAPRTVEAWIKTSFIFTGESRNIVSWGTDAAGQRNSLNVTPTGYLAFIGEFADYQTSMNVADDTWHHVAFTYDGTTVVLYVDGVLVGSAPLALSTVGNELIIGTNVLSRNDEYFIGTIDEVRIWKSVRNLTEIQTNKDNRLVGNEANLVAYYNFDEATATWDNRTISIPEIKDQTANNNHGTMSGFAKINTTSNWVQSSIFSGAKIYRVSDTPSGAMNGSDWSNTMSLQAALEGATSGDEIWVKAGNYTPTKDKTLNASPADVREKTFVMKEGVGIYGGFAGTESARNQRNWRTNPTVITGDINNDDNPSGIGSTLSLGNQGENIYRLITNENPNLSAEAILDGFILKGGYYNGIFNENSSPTIQNCRFENHATPVYLINSSATILNCIFIKNGKDAINDVDAGAIYARSGGLVKIINSVFIGNLAKYGGAICSNGTGFNIVNCSFSRNHASQQGGAIYREYDNVDYKISNSIFYENTATNGGKDIRNFGQTTINIAYCLIKGNAVITHISNVTDAGNNILGQSPLFTDPSNDLTLKPLSPAINAGNNASNVQELDLAGNPRKDDLAIDMGAYESFSPEIHLKEVAFISSGETLSFGKSEVQQSVQKTITIQNTGKGDLYLMGAMLEIEGADFTSVSPFTTTGIPASGGTLTFEVRFTPSDLGTRTATLKLYSNDSNESPYTLKLTGWGKISNQDSLALITIYQGVISADFSWNFSDEITTWDGVTVKKGRVAELDLYAKSWEGNIDPAIGDLTALESLDLSANYLEGSIPTQIGNLFNIKYLNLASNDLSGNIPAQIGFATALEYLNLSNNGLSGTIPDQVIELNKLTEIRLNHNNLSGNVPDKFITTNDGALEVVDLSHNSLSGTIPSTLHRVYYLTELRLNNNRFEAGFTNDFFADNWLKILDLSNNRLTGNLPKISSGVIYQLSELYLHENQFTGQVPKYIISDDVSYAPSQLSILTLNDNLLSGQLPNEINYLSALINLQIQNNQLTGDLPNLGFLQNLKIFYANNNQLTGNPASLGTLPNLERIKLQDNLFNDLPNFTSNTNLVNLQVENNNLDFGDLEPNKTKLISYAPQNKALNEYTHTIIAGETLFLTAQIGGANNQYQWFKGSELLPTQTHHSLTMTNALLTDGGVYYAVITTTDVALNKLTIYRNNISVQVLSASVSTQDFEALMAFYTATGGVNWVKNTHWGNVAKWGSWEGVTVNPTTGRVIAIRLPDNNLRGFLPPELKDLAQLEVLDLQNNYIGQTIPTEIGNLVLLKELYLQENELTGNIPTSFQNLNNMERIFLNDNKLQGNLLPEIGVMTNLRAFHLQNNFFSGIIPTNWENLGALRELYLYNNNLEGDLPSFFADVSKMPHLRKLRLQNNRFINIPTFPQGQIERLDVADNFLTFEDLENNAFISSFSYAPQAMVLDTLRLEKLYGDSIVLNSKIEGTANEYQWFKDSETNLVGTKTATLTLSPLVFTDAGMYWASIKNSKLPKLTLRRSPIFLDVNDPKTNEQDSLALVALYQKTEGKNWKYQWNFNNPVYTWEGVNVRLGRVVSVLVNNFNLTGKIPDDLKNLENLEFLNLSGNNLTGKIPEAFVKFDSLKTLDLKNNDLTGEIPVQIQQFIRLEFVDLSGNNLTGEIHNKFDNLQKITYINLENNLFSGKIPTQLGSLKALGTLNLSGNTFDGTIPESLGNLSNLTHLNLSNNRLEGQIPATLGNLGQLEILALNHNRLSGAIPPTLGKLAALTILDLSDNGLQGTIPADIANALRIKELYLNNNRLEGAIPISLGKLTDLIRLNLFDNSLTGQIPNSLNQLTNIKLLNLGANYLTGEIPDLSNLLVLNELNLSDNSLTGNVPQYLTRLPDLKKLYIHTNKLAGMPNFSAQLDVLQAHNNKFIFADLEPNEKISKFTYTPQADLDEVLTLVRIWGTRLELSVTDAGGTQTKYQWKKNGNNLAGTDKNIFVIESLDYADAGEYLCEIKNPLLPELTLFRQRIILQVLEPDVQISDAEVLIQLYQATDGDNWKNNDNWKNAQGEFDTKNIKNWYGITVVNDRITEINLQNNNLVGQLPNTLQFLTRLTLVRFSGNILSGEIPSGFGKLLSVKELDLSNNKFEGTIPIVLGEMRALEKLLLEGNNFTENSQIPVELGKLISLKELNLSNNKLGGRVPDEFIELQNLTKLMLNDNNLEELPDLSSIGLSELQVRNNLLTFRYLVPNRTANTFIYAPQRLGQKNDTILVEENNRFVLTINEIYLQDANQYQWKKVGKNNNDIISTTSEYFIEKATPQYTGNYKCVITNAVLPDLTMTLDYTLNVIPAFPTIIVPKAYCMSDTSVTLISEGTAEQSANTIWYDDQDLKTELGRGKKLQIAVQIERIIYVVVERENNQSHKIPVVISRRPTLRSEGTLLKTNDVPDLMYQWYKDGQKILGATESTLETNGASGQYRVNVLTTEGCSANSMTYQFANGKLEILTDNDLITSLEIDQKFLTEIYPNPFQAQVGVRFAHPYGHEIEVKLIGVDGKIYVKKSMIGNAGFILQVPELAQGVYFLHIKMGKDEIIRKIIRE